MIQQAGVIHVSMRDQNPIDRTSGFEESVDFRKDAIVAKLLCRGLLQLTRVESFAVLSEEWHSDIENNSRVPAGDFDACASDFFRPSVNRDLHADSLIIGLRKQRSPGEDFNGSWLPSGRDHLRRGASSCDWIVPNRLLLRGACVSPGLGVIISHTCDTSGSELSRALSLFWSIHPQS